MFAPCCQDFELWATNPEGRSARAWHENCDYISSGEMPMVRLAVKNGEVYYELRVETFSGTSVVYLSDYGFNNILTLGRFANYADAMIYAHDHTATATAHGYVVSDLTGQPIT